jgi:2-hydroxychromene-2-carboxylate isomerase
MRDKSDGNRNKGGRSLKCISDITHNLQAWSLRAVMKCDCCDMIRFRDTAFHRWGYEASWLQHLYITSPYFAIDRIAKSAGIDGQDLMEVCVCEGEVRYDDAVYLQIGNAKLH